MKKVVLSVAILLGSMTAFAQTEQNKETEKTNQSQSADSTANQSTRYNDATKASQAAGQTGQTSQSQQSSAASTDGFTEIKVEEVPTPVTASLKRAYHDAILQKAYVNEKKEYKLHVNVGEKVGYLYADAKGKWITKS